MSFNSYIRPFLAIFLISLNGCTQTLDLRLSSNEVDTEFIVDGNLIGTSQRIRMQIEKGLDVPHTIIARLNGYCEKKDVINPPYMQPTVVDFIYKEGDECIPCKEPCRLDYGKYYALVIGNNIYRNGIPLLETAQNDAREIAEILETKYGFIVKLIENATSDNIHTTIKDYQNGTIDEQGNIVQPKLTKYDNLLIYYAGHGEVIKIDKHESQGYWLPIDAELDNQDHWISNTYLANEIKKILAKHVLIIADSCYSGLLTRRVIRGDFRGLSGYQGHNEYNDRLWFLSSKRSRMALSAGGNEPVVDGGCKEGNHSIFACALIKSLKNNKNDILDATMLFVAVRNKLLKERGQLPEYGNIRGAGHDGGDFLFINR